MCVVCMCVLVRRGPKLYVSIVCSEAGSLNQTQAGPLEKAGITVPGAFSVHTGSEFGSSSLCLTNEPHS